jgi:hypothetical protein
MKFVSAPPSAAPQLLRFQISRLEKALLLATLQVFPVLDPEYHRVTKDPKNAAAAEQHLLEEAMARQTAEHKARLEEFLRAEAPVFQEEGEELYLNLANEQLEWLLQVLNDIRVGSWVKLGCPDTGTVSRGSLTIEETRSVAAMDMSGYFQTCLLEAFK